METVLDNAEQNLTPRLNADKLAEFFKTQRNAIVAYSGGVDSALLAYAAHRALGNGMVAVLADSPSLSRREYRFAISFAQTHGIPLQIIRTQEMESPDYLVNRADRCYYCKKALFEKIEALRRQLQGASNIEPWPVNYGVNLDDLGDYRPGMRAAREASIQAPYIDLGFDKQTIREVCAYYNLEVANKPAMPCMASRIAYGEAVTEEKLTQVEKAEDFLYKFGLKILRVRHHGQTARIEVSSANFATVMERRQEISRKFHELGFVYVALDLDGFQSGSLNAVLNTTQAGKQRMPAQRTRFSESD